MVSKRICGLIQTAKTCRSLGKEAADAVYAVVTHQGGNIGEHDQPDAIRMARAADQRSLSAARSADQCDRALKLLKQALHVAPVGIEQIIAVCRPITFAMAAQVEGYTVETGVADNPR